MFHFSILGVTTCLEQKLLLHVSASSLPKREILLVYWFILQEYTACLQLKAPIGKAKKKPVIFKELPLQTRFLLFL